MEAHSGEIDGVAGATLTSGAVREAMEEILRIARVREDIIAHPEYAMLGEEGWEEETEEDKNGTSMVTTARLNVRAGPGQDQKILGTLEKGTEVSVKKDMGNHWVKIRYNSADGYVNDNYLAKK